MGDGLDWERDGQDWPSRETSRFVETTGLRWHVQQFGQGPHVLLVHGTGASTHSWSGLAPILAKHFTLTMIDLPAHGFSSTPLVGGLSLPEMSRNLSDLLGVLAIKPALAIGHSAGAAILIRMCLDDLIGPKALVSLNGALMPFRGVAGPLFSPLAKLLFSNPFASRFFARRANDIGAVERVIAKTGSSIDQTGIAFYHRLFRTPAHVAGALGMMASWDLAPLVRDLPKLDRPLILVAGGGDRAVPADDAFRVRDLTPQAHVEFLKGVGHLAHEERPDLIVDIVTRTACTHNVVTSRGVEDVR